MWIFLRLRSLAHSLTLTHLHPLSHPRTHPRTHSLTKLQARSISKSTRTETVGSGIIVHSNTDPVGYDSLQVTSASDSLQVTSASDQHNTAPVNSGAFLKTISSTIKASIRNSMRSIILSTKNAVGTASHITVYTEHTSVVKGKTEFPSMSNHDSPVTRLTGLFPTGSAHADSNNRHHHSRLNHHRHKPGNLKRLASNLNHSQKHEENWKSVFPFQSPRILYFAIDLVITLNSLYFSWWTTNFVWIAGYMSADGSISLWRFLSALAAVLTFPLLTSAIRSSTILKALTCLDLEVMTAVVERNTNKRALVERYTTPPLTHYHTHYHNINSYSTTH